MYFTLWALAYKLLHLVAMENLSYEAIIQALKETILFQHEFHLYYLHIILLVYAFLPITRIVAKHASKQMIEYLLIVWFILGILYPFAKHFWPFTLISGIPSQWSLNLTYASIGYGVLGFYLQKYASKNNHLFIMLMLFGFIMTFGGTLLLSTEQQSFCATFFEGVSPGVCFLAVGIFGFVHSIPQGAKTRSFATRISKASFCIYLVHVFFLYAFNSLDLTISLCPSLFSIPLLAIVNLACGYGVYCVLSRIPIVRKYLI